MPLLMPAQYPFQNPECAGTPPNPVKTSFQKTSPPLAFRSPVLHAAGKAPSKPSESNVVWPRAPPNHNSASKVTAENCTPRETLVLARTVCAPKTSPPNAISCIGFRCVAVWDDVMLSSSDRARQPLSRLFRTLLLSKYLIVIERLMRGHLDKIAA